MDVRKSVLLFWVVISGSVAFSQSLKDSSIAFSNVAISFAYQIPKGDMAVRFGNNMNASGEYFFKTKQNFLFGANLNYLFGRNIKEVGMLDSITTVDGNHINLNGSFAVVALFQRGWNGFVYVGKQFSWKKIAPNPNSGIMIKLGVGFLQHRIRIDDIGNATPSLTKEYRNGYDRSTGGLALNQSIGYNYFSANRIANFFFSVDFTEGFTKSLRSYDYDLRRPDTAKRFDVLIGFRFGWIVPLYKNVASEFYYY
ncbi:MAG: hypothetical protein J0M08_10360 [Bacteroidetes bacterium]|nr:hypothetical protein [Bacteroidota bacterium]